jgi:hypothetical protein
MLFFDCGALQKDAMEERLSIDLTAAQEQVPKKIVNRDNKFMGITGYIARPPST